MTDRLEEVYEKYVKPLPPGERLRLLEMTARDLALTNPLASPKRSILELRGLGKEIWRGIMLKRMSMVFVKNGTINRDPKENKK